MLVRSCSTSNRDQDLRMSYHLLPKEWILETGKEQQMAIFCFYNLLSPKTLSRAAQGNEGYGD